MAVVAEPFGADHLVTVHAGIVHMAIHTYGITGHIGGLEGTVNAVQKMTAVINALQHVEFRYSPRADLPAFPRLNVGSIIGGRGRITCWSSRPTSPISARSSWMCTLFQV